MSRKTQPLVGQNFSVGHFYSYFYKPCKKIDTSVQDFLDVGFKKTLEKKFSKWYKLFAKN